MSATQVVLLILSILMFVYVGIAMFKPEWF